jgi:hypothetical protein
MTNKGVARPSQPAASGAYDRVFYGGMAIAMALTVFAGFAPTFYLRSVFGSPSSVTGAASLTPLAQAHGAVFTAWVLLFVVQTSLVASHRVKVHQRLGIAGSVLAAAMVILGLQMAVAAAARDSAPPGIDPLAFLAIPIFDMVVFPIFVAAALWFRRDKELHKRLMLLAYISILVAAVARLPGAISLGPLGFFGLTFIFLLIAIVYDLGSRRRVHPAYVWGGSFLVLSVPVRLMVSGTDTWRAFAGFLVK